MINIWIQVGWIWCSYKLYASTVDECCGFNKPNRSDALNRFLLWASNMALGFHRSLCISRLDLFSLGFFYVSCWHQACSLYNIMCVPLGAISMAKTSQIVNIIFWTVYFFFMLYFNEKWHLDMSFCILYGMKRREGRSLKKEKKNN